MVKHEEQKAKNQRELERKQRLKAERRLMMVDRYSLARSVQYFQALQEDQGLKINQ
jgi:hypothetical protein